MARTEEKRTILEEGFIIDKTDRVVARLTAEQRMRALGARFRAVPGPDAASAPGAQGAAQAEYAVLYARAEKLLAAEPPSWADVRELETTMMLLIGPEAVDAELTRALSLARAEKITVPSDSEIERLRTLGGDATARQRALLLNLVTDIQWVQQKKFLRRELRNRYSATISRFGLWFVLPLLIVVLDWTSGGPEALFWLIDKIRPFFTEAGQVVPVDWLEKIQAYFAYPGLPLSVASGVLGAWFSMLVSIDSRLANLSLDELRAARRSAVIWARLAFGAGAALILYFLVRSGLLSGELFPNITEIKFVPASAAAQADIAREAVSAVQGGAGEAPAAPPPPAEASPDTGSFLVPTTDLCLLIIWGVIAGFSESFIPAALTKRSDDANNG